MNAQEIVERIMTSHWDIRACPCWVCEAGRDLGFCARDEYFGLINHRYPDPWILEDFIDEDEAAEAAGGE